MLVKMCFKKYKNTYSLSKKKWLTEIASLIAFSSNDYLFVAKMHESRGDFKNMKSCIKLSYRRAKTSKDFYEIYDYSPKTETGKKAFVRMLLLNDDPIIPCDFEYLKSLEKIFLGKNAKSDLDGHNFFRRYF